MFDEIILQKTESTVIMLHKTLKNRVNKISGLVTEAT